MTATGLAVSSGAGAVTRPGTDDAAAIARSVVYAGLFDYPLTLAQLRQTLIASVQTPSQILAALSSSEMLRNTIEYRDGFFFPRGRFDLVAERTRREARSRIFLRRHRRLLQLIVAIPYVRLVALSGSIAHRNLDARGDLDLFVVTRGRKVWSVAVAIVALAKLLGLRRTVCANFIVADTHLALDQQDLFTASQIIHLKPLIGMDVFREFVAANPFVTRNYPNFHPADCAGWQLSELPRLAWLKRAIEGALTLPAAALEGATRAAYRAYLRRRAATWPSPDQVRLEDDYLKLHTHSHRRDVLRRFEEATETLETSRGERR
jgi:hypothetical protein